METVVECIVFFLITQFFYKVLKRDARKVVRGSPIIGRPLRTEEDYKHYLECVQDYETRYTEIKKERGEKIRIPTSSTLKYKVIFAVSVLFLFIHFFMASVTEPHASFEPNPISGNMSPPEVLANPPPLQEQRKIEDRSGGTTQHCVYKDGVSVYCHYEFLWSPSPLERDEKETRFMMDTNQSIYFTQFLHAASVSILVRERDLVNLLNEKKTNRCVCPSSLGLSQDGMNFFLYHAKQWTILYDCQIIRHSRRKQKTRLAEMTTGEITHYDDITVSFNSPNFQLGSEEIEELKEYNTIYYNSLQRFLYRIPGDNISRISLHLTGEDAACFTHCSSMTISSSSTPLHRGSALV